MLYYHHCRKDSLRSVYLLFVNQTEDLKRIQCFRRAAETLLLYLCSATSHYRHSSCNRALTSTVWLCEPSCLLFFSVLQECCSPCELTVYMAGIHFLLKKHTHPVNKCTVSIMDSEPQISASITPRI